MFHSNLDSSRRSSCHICVWDMQRTRRQLQPAPWVIITIIVTMATQEQRGGESEKRCVKGLERRLIQQSEATHSLIRLHAITFHPRSCRHGIMSLKREAVFWLKYEYAVEAFFSCCIYTVSAVATDCVAKHLGPASHPRCHGGWTEVRDESAVSNTSAQIQAGHQERNDTHIYIRISGITIEHKIL